MLLAFSVASSLMRAIRGASRALYDEVVNAANYFARFAPVDRSRYNSAMHRKLPIQLALVISLACAPACERDESTSKPVDTAPTVAAPVAQEVEESPEPPQPDESEDVEIDETTGWPAAIGLDAPPPSLTDDSAEPEVIQEKRKIRQKRKKSRPEKKEVAIFRGDPYIDLDGEASPYPLNQNERRAVKSKVKRRLLETQGRERSSRGGLSVWGITAEDRKFIEAPSIPTAKPTAADQPKESSLSAQTGQFSTFSVDVDTGSYSLSKGRMRRGYPPLPEIVRTEEWVNAFEYEHDVPEGQTFDIKMDVGESPISGQEQYLRVHVAGRSMAAAERPPAHLTFVVDVSGSMFGPDKLDLIKESLTYLVNNLRDDDTVAIVAYAKKTEVLMWPGKVGRYKSHIINAISKLEPGGSTALDEGLKLGYAVAFRDSHYNPGDIHRVVLLGDGRANIGAQDPETLLAPISAAVEKGVTLSTIGFGAIEFNDELMEQLAARGNGNYAFIDTFKDARRVFGEHLCGTIHVIGYDAKIQLEFTDRVKSWVLLGYRNRRLETEDFRDDTVDAGEIGAGHQVTAVYRLSLREDTEGPIATARLRWHDDERKTHELERTTDKVQSKADWSPDFRFAVAVAETAIKLRDPKGVKTPMSDLSRLAEEGVGRDWPARQEFLGFLRELEPLLD